MCMNIHTDLLYIQYVCTQLVYRYVHRFVMRQIIQYLHPIHIGILCTLCACVLIPSLYGLCNHG